MKTLTSLPIESPKLLCPPAPPMEFLGPHSNTFSLSFARTLSHSPVLDFLSQGLSPDLSPSLTHVGSLSLSLSFLAAISSDFSHSSVFSLHLSGTLVLSHSMFIYLFLSLELSPDLDSSCWNCCKILFSLARTVVETPPEISLS